ncbi:MAG TPA: YdjY domain-containing protein [Phycisphaerae bacterium]|nr:YdjY domain-containing protein [Phycisphaerae bacterium]
MSCAARIILGVLVLLVAGVAWAGEARPEAPQRRVDRFKPLILETDDLRRPRRTDGPEDAGEPDESRLHVDAKAHTVRIPAAPTRTRGVVEWLLAASDRHPAASVLVTACSASDLATAMAEAGLKPGVRPVPVGDDRARPPAGQTVEVTLLARGPGERTDRLPVERLLAAKPDGSPLGKGRWVYVGPQVLREGDEDVLVTALSGSIITTNLRDPTAMIYWVPDPTADPAPYVRAYYASPQVVADGAICDIGIRLVDETGTAKP